jgi:hypothetical protein
MLNSLKNLVTFTDFISEKPQVLLNKSSRSKSIYGGCLSLISLILISIALLKFGYEMVKRTNSTLTYNQTPVSNASFDYSQFPFMVALLDNGLKLIENEDRYYYFLADIWNFSPDNSSGQIVMNLNRTKVETEKCNLEKHFGIFKDYFKDVPYLNHHYCAVPGQNITLFGIYGSIQPYNFLDFWISTCVNDTSVNRTNCFSREKSQARLVNTYISYQYLDYFIDHSNISDPGQLILRSEILPVSSTIYKRDFFYIRNIKYFTDLDFIFSSSNSQNYQKVSALRETSDLRPQGTVSGSFALLSILMDSSVDQYNRRFTKFQEVLANLGGLFKGICIISEVLNYIFFDELYYMNLIEGIFKNTQSQNKLSFKENQNKVEMVQFEKSVGNFQSMKDVTNPNSFLKLIDKNKEVFPTEINNNNNLVLANQLNNQKKIELKKNEINIKNQTLPIGKFTLQKLKPKSNDINLSFFEMICARFYSNKGKFRIYNLAKQYTQKHLCIKNILFKLSEINKLKCFVFSPEQISIFDSMETPSYHYLDSNTQDIWEDIVLMNKKVDKETANLRFKQKENYTEIDQNFIYMISLFE